MGRTHWAWCASWGLLACAHTSVPSSAELRAQGRLDEAYEMAARELCAEPTSINRAVAFVEVWSALGGAGEPGARLERCAHDPAVDSLVAGLVHATHGDHLAAEQTLAQAELAATSVADRAELAYRRGLVALRAGDLARALTALDRAAGLAPSRVDVRLASAQARVESGDFDGAARQVRGLLGLQASAAELARARRLYDGIVRRAEPALDAAATAEVEDLLATLEQGAVGQEHQDRAAALTARHAHSRVWTVAGMTALRLGDLAEGVAQLEAAGRASPLDPDPWRILGVAHFVAERYTAALGPLREAVARLPLDASTQRLLADTASRVGEVETALVAQRALLRLEATSVEAYLALARLERRAGHAVRARAVLEQGYALEPRHVGLLLERAAVEAELAVVAASAEERAQATSRARGAVAELLEVSPEHPGASTILAALARHASP